ncbi:hypothetical protein KI387_004646, partial [Taxus chinensis]
KLGLELGTYSPQTVLSLCDSDMELDKDAVQGVVNLPVKYGSQPVIIASRAVLDAGTGVTIRGTGGFLWSFSEENIPGTGTGIETVVCGTGVGVTETECSSSSSGNKNGKCREPNPRPRPKLEGRSSMLSCCP